MIVPNSRDDQSFSTYDFGSDGSLATSDPFFTNPFDANIIAAESYQSGETEFLIASAYSDAGISLYRNDQIAGLVLTDRAELDEDVYTLATAVVGSQRFALAAFDDGDSVETYEISTADSMTLVADGGPEDEVGIAGISNIETVVMGDRTFALVTAFGSSSLTILEIMESGDLIPTDHILDRLDTRFARASELKVVWNGDQTLILVAGNDDWFSIL